MQTPDITQAQKGTAGAASTLLLAIIASPATDIVKCVAIGAVAIVAVGVVASDALIRRGRASIVEAAQYAPPSDDGDD